MTESTYEREMKCPKFKTKCNQYRLLLLDEFVIGFKNMIKTYKMMLDATVDLGEKDAKMVEYEMLDAMLDVVAKYRGVLNGGLRLEETDDEC